MVKISDLAWAAGLLEGEGSFGWINGYPYVSIEMTDEDVIRRYAGLFPTRRGRKVMHRKNRNDPFSGNPRKDTWRYEIQGPYAVGLMMSILPFMGTRRSQKIKSILVDWRVKHYRDTPGAHRHRGERQALLTHCKRGHSYLDPKNVYIKADGGRACRGCHAITSGEFRLRRAES